MQLQKCTKSQNDYFEIHPPGQLCGQIYHLIRSIDDAPISRGHNRFCKFELPIHIWCSLYSSSNPEIFHSSSNKGGQLSALANLLVQKHPHPRCFALFEQVQNFVESNPSQFRRSIASKNAPGVPEITIITPVDRISAQKAFGGDQNIIPVCHQFSAPKPVQNDLFSLPGQGNLRWDENPRQNEPLFFWKTVMIRDEPDRRLAVIAPIE